MGKYVVPSIIYVYFKDCIPLILIRMSHFSEEAGGSDGDTHYEIQKLCVGRY